MKYIVFSDIHSNLEALTAFLEIADSTEYARHIRVCLGDTVGYAADPEACVDLVRQNCPYGIAGNHERMLLYPELRGSANLYAFKAIEWSQDRVTAAQKNWLLNLPLTQVVGNRFLIVHGSPNDPDEYITRHRQAVSSIETLKKMKLKISFFGHTHLPGILDENGMNYYSAGMPFSLSPGQYYLINPGSVGQPRDGDPRGSFCEWDEETNTVVFRRFEYDKARAAAKIEERGLPKELGERLFLGR